MSPQLIEIEEARGRVLARVPRLDPEPVALRRALGRVLAEDARSGEPVPRFDNSAMDGFAVRAADTRGASAGQPVGLTLIDESRAGRPAQAALQAGEAIAISTGAALPAGADAVVRVEDARRSDAGIAVSAEVEPGRDIRRAGEDIAAGATVLETGTVLGPSELGVLASLDVAEPLCARTPRLSLLTTGDELIDPGEQAGPGAVRNTNAYALPALAREAGAEVVSIAKVGDDSGATRRAIESMLDSDLAVICGGVSVGEHDHVKEALAELGVEQVFWGVALRPGRPTWFGLAPSGALVFGLPGNPVSAVVTFVLFARPALRAMQGADPAAVRVAATLAEDYRKRPGRAHAVRCTLTPDGDGLRAKPTGPQGSHVLTSMLGADGLAVIPAHSAGAEAGERVEVELLPGRLSSGR